MLRILYNPRFGPKKNTITLFIKCALRSKANVNVGPKPYSNDISIFNSLCGFITRHNEKPSKLSTFVRLNGFHSTNRKYHTNPRHCFFPFMTKVASSSYSAQRPLRSLFIQKQFTRFELQRLIIQQETRHLTPRNIFYCLWYRDQCLQ